MFLVAGCGRVNVGALQAADDKLTAPALKRIPLDLAGADRAARAALKLDGSAVLVKALLGIYDAAGQPAPTSSCTDVLRYVKPNDPKHVLYSAALDVMGRASVFQGKLEFVSPFDVHVSFQDSVYPAGQLVSLLATRLPTPLQLIGMGRKAGLKGETFAVEYEASPDGVQAATVAWTFDGTRWGTGESRVFDTQTGQLVDPAPASPAPVAPAETPEPAEPADADASS